MGQRLEIRDVVDQEIYIHSSSHSLTFPHFTPKKESVPWALDDFPLIGPEPKTKGLRAQTVLVQCTFFFFLISELFFFFF